MAKTHAAVRLPLRMISAIAAAQMRTKQQSIVYPRASVE